MKTLQLIFSLLTLLIGGLLIGASCEYTSSAGPMNINFRTNFAIVGLAIVVIGYIILLLSKNTLVIKSVLLIVAGLLIVANGQFWMIYTKSEINQKYNGESAGAVDPGLVCILILYFVSCGLMIHGLILALKKIKTAT